MVLIKQYQSSNSSGETHLEIKQLKSSKSVMRKLCSGEVSNDKDYIKEISRLINEWLIEVQSGNVVRLTCDAGVTATEAIKAFKK